MKVVKVNYCTDHKSITGIAVNCMGWIYYLFNGFQHRCNGPAELSNDGGFKYWFKYGILHRIDGPAVVYSNGHKEWYLNGKKYNGIYTDKEWKMFVSLQVFK